MAPAFEDFCAAVCRRVTYGPAHASSGAHLAGGLPLRHVPLRSGPDRRRPAVHVDRPLPNPAACG
ncbi:hypothetical protein CE91St41_06580 [Oscillospiraceae bacterium]|nr:hypothetical protein CE91St40_06580 [Oscillospiraceae bacterium]BDF73769.1 hypothetical protein CE91St41_06580 [Oscillospiraceae bacterium]